MPNITLLVSPSCGACPSAKSLWKQLRVKYSFSYREVDITTPDGQELANRHAVRAVPATIIKGERSLVAFPKTARSDDEVIRQFGLRDTALQLFTYREDVDRVLFQGGLYMLQVHPDLQGRPEYAPVLTQLARYMRARNIWTATGVEIARWWLAKSALEVNVHPRSKRRLSVVVSNPSGVSIEQAVIQALEGLEIDTPGGHRIFRKEDHQAMYEVPWGKTRSDPKYPFKTMGEQRVIPAKEFFEPFPPDLKFGYRRDTHKTPEHFIKWVTRILERWETREIQALLGDNGVDPGKIPDMRSLSFVQIDEFYPMDASHHNSFHYYVNEFYIKGFGLDPRRAILINSTSLGNPGTRLPGRSGSSSATFRRSAIGSGS